MRYLRYLALLAVCVIPAAIPSQAQVRVGVGIGYGPAYGYAAPVCDYGYYSYYPYACAPYGFYGPDWFSGGVFIGAGPWFHGPDHFYGHVDNHFHPEHGYHGPYPGRGEAPRADFHPEHMENFHGNEMRDGHGHVGGGHR